MNTTRGGARKGAGRPNGRDHKSINISLPIHMVEYLKTFPGNRSRFIAEAISQAIIKVNAFKDSE